MQKLAAALAGLEALQELDIARNSAGGPGLVAVLEALRRPAGRPGVTRLQLAGNALSPQDADGIAGRLSWLENVEVLDVSAMRLGRDGVAAVLSSAAALPRLRELTVARNELCSVDMLVFAPQLTALPALQHVQVGVCPAL